MAADAISFFWVGRDGLTAEMDVLDVLGRSLLQNLGNPSTTAGRQEEQWQVERNQSCVLDGILDTTRERAAFSS